MGKIYKKTFFAIGIVIVIVIAISIFSLPSHRDQPLQSGGPAPFTPVMLNAKHLPQVKDSILSVVGTIEAGDIVTVTAPFDAGIKEKKFSFDTQVLQDQLLLTLDTTDLLTRLQEAKVGMLKAAKTLRELENWEKGTEVARAQRGSVLARQQVEQAKRKVREAETLLEKGIIPRSEYDGLIEQLNSYQAQLAAALDDVRATSERASKSNYEIARIEYEQAQAKYKDLSDSLAFGKIKAPRAGIIAKVPVTSSQAPAMLEVGSRIAKGQLLFNIISMDKLKVSAKINEVDIVDLAPGMKVEISMDSQDLSVAEGRISEISAQAVQSGGASGSASFDIKIEISELNAEQRRRLRVGMSCNVNIQKVKKEPPVISSKFIQIKKG
jgi:multidrug resistance efflux pump